MQDFTVFYSWQSDTPRKTGRQFIHDAAKLAIDRIANGSSLEDAPRLEHDTEGIAGIPAIGDAILRRIERCGVFLADVSLVGEIELASQEKKKTPNPNVLLELGYAIGRVGWQRIILVMNTAYGDAEQLPFDLRFRRFPFRYQISDDRRDIDKQRDSLSTNIELAINVMAREEHQAVTDTVAKLDGHAIHLIRRHSKDLHFWQTEVGDNKLPGQLDLVIRWLLELGIIECISFSNDVGFAYRWTYMGRLCIDRLGLPLPVMTTLPMSEEPTASVITDTSAYDSLILPRSNDSDNEAQ